MNKYCYNNLVISKMFIAPIYFKITYVYFINSNNKYAIFNCSFFWGKLCSKSPRALGGQKALYMCLAQKIKTTSRLIKKKYILNEIEYTYLKVWELYKGIGK